MAKKATDVELYADTTAFPEVCRYANANTEHAHQTALFMWAARANAELDKELKTVAGYASFYSTRNAPGKDLYRGFEPPQLRKMKLLFAIPNGGERAQAVAARLKAEGVKSGVSDLFLPCPIYNDVAGKGAALVACGLFLEMKRPEVRVPSPRGTAIKQARGVVSAEQLAWFSYMQENGYKTAVAHTFLEALDCIWEYFNE